MILKVTLLGGETRLFDNIKNLTYSGKEACVACPPIKRNSTGTASIIHHMKNVFLSAAPYENECTGLTPEPVDKSIPDPNTERYQFDAWDPEEDAHFIFTGHASENEQFIFKKVAFIYMGKQHYLLTEFPVYACNDSGKTIEVIR